ncbi:sigma-70 family RNA polymerase sigma factor [Bacillus infantis]|uniref:sigma-70 family RNA polymerase sigma factor n=1 Tax=Bacillus infantis TaxID=324767 RepID=UPI003CF202B5
MEDNQGLHTISTEIKNLEKRFKQEIEPYRTLLWKYCYRLTGSPWDAEDLVQDTLLKSLAMLSKVFQELNVKSYLFKIATNTWIDQQRKNRIAYTDSYPVEILESDSEKELEILPALDYLARQLSPKQFVCLLLTDVFLFTAKETAVIISLSPGAVYANVQRARDLLKVSERQQNRRVMKGPASPITHDKTISTLLEGFRRKDPDMIASLLDENLLTDITHAGVEFGKRETEGNSLKDWAEVVSRQQGVEAAVAMLWGRQVILEFALKSGEKLLQNIHFMELENDKIVYWKYYCFSWDLMNAAAKELDVKLGAEYFYHIF